MNTINRITNYELSRRRFTWRNFHGNRLRITNKQEIFVCFVLTLIALMVISNNTWAQTNVTLTSVSPTSALVGATVIVNGSNLLQCAPTHLNLCNVQFHDINLRRSTTSGTETSNTTVQATVAAGLCPGTTTIKVGEVANFSNAIPFTILDQPGTALYAGCRVITSVAPISGTFGTNVTINGRNLHSNVQLYDSSLVKIDVTGAINMTGTVVTFAIPNGITPGVYSVRVGPNVSDVSNGLPFTVTGDTTAPAISNIRITNITTTGATVTWDTNEPADSQVEFCTSASRCSTNTPLISTLTTSHVVSLANLTQNRRYYLWIKSKDGRGNLATAGPMTFKTLITATPTPTPTITPTPGPSQVVISNIQVTNITRFTATVTWNTDRSSDSKVLSCAFRVFCYKILASDVSLNTTHSLNISDLRPNNSYAIQARSADSDGAGSSNVVLFNTQPGLNVTNIQANNITNSTATITWESNYLADSGVIVCTSALFCYVRTANVTDPNPTLSHSLSLTGLLPGKKYYYRVLSADSASIAKGSLKNFTTSN